MQINTLAGILPLFRRTDASGSPVDRVLHYDHVGNVMAESDTSGVVTSTHEYDAFGRPVLSDAGSWWDQNSLHHSGKHYDADTGLFYFNARWYDAQTGRFNSANTPFQPLAEHPYALAEGDPVGFADPSGLRRLPDGVGRTLDEYFVPVAVHGHVDDWKMGAGHRGAAENVPWATDPFGDYDGDGIRNLEDCYPGNPLKPVTYAPIDYGRSGDLNVGGTWLSLGDIAGGSWDFWASWNGVGVLGAAFIGIGGTNSRGAKEGLDDAVKALGDRLRSSPRHSGFFTRIYKPSGLLKWSAAGLAFSCVVAAGLSYDKASGYFGKNGGNAGTMNFRNKNH